ncbi:MAG: macrolide family glycosyltransferase [Actinophytocola sp.]|uniref:macrolide family glycosyltransferase n=1 Tax=Actinophytocola sp. TaxID=1872138 RepID=UPI003C776660
MPPHIAFVPVTGAGHVNPALAVAEELRIRGNRVSFAATAKFASQAARAGVEVVPYRSTLPADAPTEVPPEERLRRTMSLIVEESMAVVRQLEVAYRGDRPDAVAYDGPVMAGRLLALRWGVPGVRLLPMFATPEQYVPDDLRVTDALAALAALAALVPESADEVRDFLSERDLSGVRAADFMNNREECCVSFLPRAFHPGGNEFDRRFTFAGPCLGADRLAETWPGDEGPQVLVSLGTVHNANTGFFGTAMTALADLALRAVIVTGGRVAPADLPAPPPNVSVRSRVPHLAALARASVYVCHGGMGSVMEALYHGVPVIVVPQSPEHRVTGERVRELGLGRCVPPETLTTAKLTNTLRATLSDKTIAARCTRMRADIRKAGGKSTAANAIERFLAEESRPG